MLKEFKDSFVQNINKALGQIDWGQIDGISDTLYKAKEKGEQIFFFGNGGSHSIATHMAADLGKGTKLTGMKDQKFYKCLSLDNESWVTAQANDGEEPFVKGDYPGNYQHGYDGVFVGQMENFIDAGDIVFGISSSGNSPNIINALQFAKSKKAVTIAMVGFDGGEAAQIAEYVIHVKTEKGEYGIVEGVHSVIHHYLYERAKLLEKNSLT